MWCTKPWLGVVVYAVLVDGVVDGDCVCVCVRVWKASKDVHRPDLSRNWKSNTKERILHIFVVGTSSREANSIQVRFMIHHHYPP